jgi:hypothetical protein
MAITWAQRLKRVFNIDITTCEECGGTVKVIPKAFAVLTGQALASIEDPAVMPNALAALAGQALKQILAHLQRKEESKEFNPLPESRAPPQIGLFG